ncbi:MAG: nucleotidyl transferase AbiEii/AbiGii toxin family protein [Hamadaea sp.]|uniref:nucleotidyl transferase AbiEii/AbiGii toxin family protein n=1 Tax=Hamadaea sp. TaxID=2024425 RepID=UPI0017D649B4|nr:nucleotidyl transferase AbiEii/AbiGii toxin family protein [Hamadaea sp.]NUT19799.1 nucleotidyl transferase AbiEii/AbiGii toxin family protein [Hamadaea sp.]
MRDQTDRAAASDGARQGDAALGLSMEDLAREADRFGVSDEQVHRDHAISHVLAALSDEFARDVIFFGGTALSRTHLLHARLSEDIDLLALTSRADLADRLTKTVSRRVLRTLGRVSWEPGFNARDDVQPAVLMTAEGIAIKVQLLSARGYTSWPVEMRQIEQRYLDARPATLQVPTISSFAGWKTDAWFARRASRDLYDLWALAERGAIDADAVAAYVKFGSTGGPPRPFMFSKAPTGRDWEESLAGQTRLEIGPEDALLVVRNAWASAQGEVWDKSV